MSLFDVLRYQISVPPTEAELEALPKGILKKWLVEIGALGWHSYDDASHLPGVIAEYYQRNNRRDDLFDIPTLKRIIKEHDNESL